MQPVTKFFLWFSAIGSGLLAGGLIYVAGMFLCTAFFNVPLNNALGAVDPASWRRGSGAGALPETMDDVESCPDDLVRGSVRAVYLGNFNEMKRGGRGGLM